MRDERAVSGGARRSEVDRAVQVLEVPLIRHEVKHVQDAPHRVRLARPGRTLHEREREIVVAPRVSSVVLTRGGVRGRHRRRAPTHSTPVR